MNGLETGIHYALDTYGATLPNWRIKILDAETVGHSDWAKVYVEVYKPRCRKPCTTWCLAVNMVREIVDFERSTFIRH